MTVLSRHPSLRWLVPAVLAVALATGGSALGLLSAQAEGPLAPRTASQLLVDVQEAELSGLSGTVVQDAELGLPSLPGVGGSGSSELSSLVSGSHTLRVWYAGPDKARVALLGSLGESDVVRNGDDLWTWSSRGRTATHRTLPSRTSRTPETGAAITPQKAAETALAAISPTTKVSTGGTATVAGRSAYELVLEPKDASSLVGSVRIALDGRTRIPVRVQVFARDASKPALQVGFTSFDPTAPDDSVFAFDPPAGTKVTEEGGSTDEQADPGDAREKTLKPGTRAPGGAPRVVGTGWTSVVVTRVPAAATGSAGKSSDDEGSGTPDLAGVLRSLPRVSGSWGSGHLLRGTLFSALLTDDGRLVVGAVAPSALYAALAG